MDNGMNPMPIGYCDLSDCEFDVYISGDKLDKALVQKKLELLSKIKKLRKKDIDFLIKLILVLLEEE